jgi:DNA-directed RNA polymerase sigma subunit (sigma70/sigma32)
MHASATYEANKRLMDSFAWKVIRRVSAAGGRGVEIADVKQELAIAWAIAAERWNPEAGVPFGAYLRRGMEVHINRWADKEIHASRFAPFSLDFNLSGEAEGDGDTLGETVADESESPEDTCHYKRMREDLAMHLSPTADLFLSLLEDPPEEVVAIFRAQQAKAEYAKSRGYSSFHFNSISESLIFDILGLGPYERAQIRKEIKRAVEKVRGRR